MYLHSETVHTLLDGQWILKQLGRQRNHWLFLQPCISTSSSQKTNRNCKHIHICKLFITIKFRGKCSIVLKLYSLRNVTLTFCSVVKLGNYTCYWMDNELWSLLLDLTQQCKTEHNFHGHGIMINNTALLRPIITTIRPNKKHHYDDFMLQPFSVFFISWIFFSFVLPCFGRMRLSFPVPGLSVDMGILLP
jgi:hypothetical protein